MIISKEDYKNYFNKQIMSLKEFKEKSNAINNATQTTSLFIQTSLLTKNSLK